METYIWGVCDAGKFFVRDMSHLYNIVGFVDSNPMKQIGTYCGLPVEAPEFLNQRENTIVMVAAMATYDIFPVLETFGYKRFETLFSVRDF